MVGEGDAEEREAMEGVDKEESEATDVDEASVGVELVRRAVAEVATTGATDAAAAHAASGKLSGRRRAAEGKGRTGRAGHRVGSGRSVSGVVTVIGCGRRGRPRRPGSRARRRRRVGVVVIGAARGPAPTRRPLEQERRVVGRPAASHAFGHAGRRWCVTVDECVRTSSGQVRSVGHYCAEGDGQSKGGQNEKRAESSSEGRRLLWGLGRAETPSRALAVPARVAARVGGEIRAGRRARNVGFLLLPSFRARDF